MGTKNNPGVFDCYEAAEDDEPMFVLLARDPVAPLLILLWLALREACGEPDDAKLGEAAVCAREMWKWSVAKGKRESLMKAAAAFAESEGMPVQEVLDIFEGEVGEALEKTIKEKT